MSPQLLRIVLVVAALLGSNAVGRADPVTEREASANVVKSLTSHRAYGQLDALADEYRQKKTMAPTGIYKISYFYDDLMLQDSRESVADCGNQKLNFAQNWIASFPESITAHIVYAKTLISKASCIRGSGYVDSISPKKLRLYRGMIEKARLQLNECAKITPTDPEWYAVMAEIAQQQGWPRTDFIELVEKGTSTFPLYYKTYERGMFYFLPEWEGNDGDVDAYAHWVMQRTQSLTGTDAYARLYVKFLGDTLSPELLEKAQVNHSLLRSSMESVALRYPERWNYIIYATASCRLGDFGEAKLFLEKIGPQMLVLPWELAAQKGDCSSFSKIPAVSPETWAMIEKQTAAKARELSNIERWPTN